MVDESEERKKQLENDKLFLESFDKLKKGNYLGDLTVLQHLLRFAASELLSEFDKTEESKYRMAELEKRSITLGHVLLGRTKSFQSMRNWNAEGGIDEFCAKWLGLSEKDATQRMEHAAVKFFAEILDVVDYASQDGVLEEQWGFQIDVTIERFSKIFLGITPGQQVAMDVQ